MIRITRRTFLLSSAATSMGLAACTIPSTPAQVFADIRTISAALTGVAPALLSAVGEAKSKGIVATSLAQIQLVSGALADSFSATQTRSAAAQVIGAVQAIVSVLGDIVTLPVNVQQILQAASALLPIVASAAGLAMATTPSSAPLMPVSQARAVLVAAAKG